MKCAACGRENRTTAGFCAFCGARLSQKATEAPKPVSAEASAADARDAAAQPASSAPPAAAATAPQPQQPLAEAAPTGASGTSEAEGPQGDMPQAPLQLPSPTEGAPAGPPAPRQPGEILGGRYEVVELLESTPERNQYRAIDPHRCFACGFDDNPPGAEYCRECGASLERPTYVTVLELVQQPPDKFDASFSEGQRNYYVTLEPPPAPEKPAAKPSAPRPIRLLWGRATDQGKTRDHNEDYVEVWLYAKGSGGLLGLFVVADGLGGQDSGEVASKLATDTLWSALRDSIWEPVIRGETLEPGAVEERLIAGVQAANQAVFKERQARGSEMSTTMTLALVLNDTAYVANVGDSRTYLWNSLGLQKISKDHSLVQRLVDTGMIAPGDVYTHPQRNLIYQSIGDRPDIRADTFRRALQPDDHLILCSDGLWEMVRDEGIEEVLLSEPDPQRACDRLVRDANLAGGEDNISIVIVNVVGV